MVPTLQLIESLSPIICQLMAVEIGVSRLAETTKYLEYLNKCVLPHLMESTRQVHSLSISCATVKPWVDTPTFSYSVS